MCKTCGMGVENTKWKYDVLRPPPRQSDPSRDQAFAMLQQSLRALPGRPDLVLILLSNDDKVFYAGIKYATVFSHLRSLLI